MWIDSVTNVKKETGVFASIRKAPKKVQILGKGRTDINQFIVDFVTCNTRN
jgi:hypothetical protein